MITTIGDIVKFYRKYPNLRGTIKVKTRFGFNSIQEAKLSAYNSDVLQIYTQCGKNIKVSPDHLLLSNNVTWVKSKDLIVGNFLFTEAGPTRIVKIKSMEGKRNLYDLQVENVHEFYANGIVSHNSVLLEVLCFSLFGKPFRKINKPQLLNTKNRRELLCEIEFIKNGVHYLIRRGIAPAIFEVHRDGVLIDQSSSSRDYQDNFEKNVLQFDYAIFTQIIILGRATYIGFMKLVPDQRRKFIENILGLNIFSLMNEVHKNNLVTLKTELASLKNSISLSKDKIELRESYIKKLELDVKNNQNLLVEKIEEKISIIQIEIDELTNKILTVEKLRPDVDHSLKSILKNRKQQLNELIIKSSLKHERLNKDMEFIKDNTICPSCNQTIDEEIRRLRQQELVVKIESINNIIVDINKKIDDTTEQLNEFELIIKTDHEVNQQLSALNASRNEKQKQIVSFEKEKTIQFFDDVEKIEQERSILTELKDTYEIELSRKSDLLDRYEYYDIISGMLKDGGIKKMIIKRYIPIINNLANQFLKELGFFVRFEIDEEFEEHIYLRGIDELSYFNFSEGEKLRIDLAIMMMWREIAKLQNNMNTNLLVLDEIMEASADVAGTEAFIELLNKQTEMNVFVISHSPDRWSDKFRSSISISKEAGFSKIDIKS